jgi:hypothetical protein
MGFALCPHCLQRCITKAKNGTIKSNLSNRTRKPQQTKKSVGANYMFTAEQIYNMAISPIRTSRFILAVIFID